MKSIILIASLFIMTCAILPSCKKETAGDPRVPNLPAEVYKYNELPEGSFSAFGNITVQNEMATLGRVLFYENQLSINNRVSCGTCHNQSKGFADNAAFSSGFENKLTKRNTPAIINAGTQTSYFWDMRENFLEAMVTQPIGNHIEMGLEEPDYIVAKVKALPYYKELFTAAFGDENVTINRIGEALGDFVGSMVSVNSKYDAGRLSSWDNYTSLESMGKSLFTDSLPCASCHGGDNFSGWGSFTQNIGLDMDYDDNGQPGSSWTGGELDGWFKVPTLRNVELTAPYMHDGRFATLEEVIEFYNSGIQAHEQLSFNLREGWNNSFFFEGDIAEVPATGNSGTALLDPLRMHLTPMQKSALVAFLKTLTDDKVRTDVKFSDPFAMN